MDKIKKYVSFFFIFFVTIFSVCAKQPNINDATKKYDKKGLKGYVKYVEDTQTYFEIHDAEKNGITPFLLAVKECDIESITILYRYGANLTKERDNSNNDFFDYIINHNISEFSKIVDVIPGLYWSSSYTKDGLPILRLLNNPYNSGRLSVLLDKKIVSPEMIINSDMNLLMYAAKNSYTYNVEKLLGDTSVLNKFNGKGINALMYAARYNPDKNVLETLLKYGASVEGNPNGFSLTMLAACNDNPGVLLAVPKTDNNLNKKTIKGKTALMFACENCKTTDSIEILLNEFNEDIDSKDEDGKTALDYFKGNPNFKDHEFPYYR